MKNWMRHPIIVRAALSAAAFAALTLALALVGDAVFLESSVWFLAAIVAASALALPWVSALVYVGAAGALALIVRFLSEAKISLTEMPLTFLDLRIGLANPMGFFGAMKISGAAVVLGLCAFAVIATVLTFWRLSRVDWRRARANAGPRAVALALVGVMTAASLTLFARRLEAAAGDHELAEIANMPDGLLLMAKKVGATPFLALTALYDASTATPFRELATRDPDAAAASTAPPAWLKPLAAPAQKPDIFIVLLESTFDLPKVFDVEPAMRSDLFPDAQRGQLQGELGVNAIGGGTWISEFEAITGIPSRLFGYAGYYTHVELAPYVKASLATWLKDRGYGTLGLYPVEGKFYGARAAYARYGFDNYRDGVELGIEKPWYAEDTDIMRRYIDVIEKTDASRPLFTFALTMENHSPHPCTRFGSPVEMPYRFARDKDTRATCELNEYIARYRSTEAAIAMLENALRARAKKTGRPYVLALFGDHQPNTFTGTAKSPFWTPHDYSQDRRASNDVTFYQIRSTAPSPFATANLDTSIVLLPTLVSAYVASGLSDVYLPGNFGIQAQCGEKITLPRSNSAHGKDAMIPDGQPNSGAATPLPQRCRNALADARADYLKLIELP